MMPLMPSTLIAPAASAPEVHITYTGGTIGMVESPHGLIPGADLDSWLAELLEGTALAGRVSLTVLDPLIDSANATPESWQAIIDDLRAHRAATPADGTDGINGADGVKSYVVLHGTDTMAYTSAALSYALTDFDRPVVVTGAQLPLSAIGSDAASNVTGALNAATSGRADGVSLFFGHHLLAGNRATKTSSWAFEGFASPRRSAIGDRRGPLAVGPASCTRRGASDPPPLRRSGASSAIRAPRRRRHRSRPGNHRRPAAGHGHPPAGGGDPARLRGGQRPERRARTDRGHRRRHRGGHGRHRRLPMP